MVEKGGAYFEWRDNIPYVVDREPTTRQSLSALIAGATVLPYEHPKERKPDEERFKGLSNVEVLAIRLAEKAANGDYDATNQVLDRILGKPKQETQNVTVSVTYADYLDNLDRRIQANTTVQIEDVSPTLEIKEEKKYANLEDI